MTNRSEGDSSNRASPTAKPLMPSSGGKERGVPPHTIPATACRNSSRPRVTITAFIGGPFSIGRTSTRSTTAPRTNPETRAATSPSQYEPVAWITPSATNVVIISMPPWAKLTIRVARQMSTRASATAA